MKVKAKKNNTGKAIGAVLLALVLLVGGAVAGWFAHAQNWFGTDQKEKQESGSTGGLIVGEGTGNGITIVTARTSDTSVLSQDSYTLTATVSPYDAGNKQVDWSLSWSDESAEWAIGKTVTDYVTITPDADGSTTAILACSQAFGEQIIVKCTSRENTSISATATVDYVRRADFEIELKKGSEVVNGITWTQTGEEYTASVTPSYSVYTIEDSFTFEYHLSLREEFINSVQVTYNGILNPGTMDETEGVVNYVSQRGSVFSFDDLKIFSSYDELVNKYLILQNSNTFTLPKDEVRTKNSFKNKVESYNGVMFDLEIKVTGTYCVYSVYKQINCIGADFSVSIEGITLPENSYIF